MTIQVRDDCMTAPRRFTPDDTRGFRDALGQFATGVTIITTLAEDGPTGMTCNSFASVSLEPPLVLWSLAKSAGRYGIFTQAQHININVLNADQGPLAKTFARDGRAFTPQNAYQNDAGVPVLRGAVSVFECTREAIFEGGDHAIILCRVHNVTLGTGAPLVFHHGSFGSFRDL